MSDKSARQTAAGLVRGIYFAPRASYPDLEPSPRASLEITTDDGGRPSREEIAILRRAAQNQFVRWSLHGIDAAGHDRREHLRRAHHTIKTVKDGCDLRREPLHQPWQLGSRDGADS